MSLRGFYVNMQCIVFCLLKKAGGVETTSLLSDGMDILLCLEGDVVKFKSLLMIPVHLFPWANVNQLHYRDVVSNPQHDVLAIHCLWICLHPSNTWCGINSSTFDFSAECRKKNNLWGMRGKEGWEKRQNISSRPQNTGAHIVFLAPDNKLSFAGLIQGRSVLFWQNLNCSLIRQQHPRSHNIHTPAWYCRMGLNELNSRIGYGVKWVW